MLPYSNYSAITRSERMNETEYNKMAQQIYSHKVLPFNINGTEVFKDNSIENTFKRVFIAKNIGNLPVTITNLLIEDKKCEGYGLKVENCKPFTLLPG